MPALNALRAFEAAARHRSFSAAAEELNVTAGAIAQHVKSLEAWTGEKLFKRNPQGIELTALGVGVLADFTTAFDRLGDAVRSLRSNATPRDVRIAALPSIAQLWVSPRLPEIRDAMPEISISVTALEQPPNMTREPFDLAVFYEDLSPANNSIVIGEDNIFPVCCPAVAQRLHTPADLANEVFLHDTTWKDDWDIWFSEVCAGENLNKSGPEFSLYALALEECKNGAGIMIGHEHLVRSQLESGALVQLFDKKIPLKRNLAIRTANPVVSGSLTENVVNRLLASPKG